MTSFLTLIFPPHRCRAIAGARALVTGASGGLGRAIALELARQGASVVLVARRVDALREVAHEITGSGGRAEIIAGDITSPTIRRAALDTAQSALGGLDMLVNNAGVGAIGRFESAAPQRLREVFETNFFAPAELTREALPLLRQGRNPIVVNVGSILGHLATPLNTDYCASKFALRGLSESLRAELFKEGIDVMMASPGPTSTEFWDHLVEQQADVPWMSSHAQRPDQAARRIVRAIAHGRRESFPSFRARFLVWLNRMFPDAVARFVQRYI